VVNPPKPLPAWTAADFDCGAEPVAPPQETTKKRAENYQVDTLKWGRTCKTILQSRGADADRYGLLGAEKK